MHISETFNMVKHLILIVQSCQHKEMGERKKKTCYVKCVAIKCMHVAVVLYHKYLHAAATSSYVSL